MHKIFFVLIFLVAIAILFVFFESASFFQFEKGNKVENVGQEPVSQGVTVQMVPEGFIPAEVVIKKGEAVTFLNNDSVNRWPASNLHPTHGIYPEFDPQQPLDPGESWLFRFDKVGEWKFHDHLKPLFRGVIQVQI